MDLSSVRSASRKTRSACNRCHAQKLRCVRKAGHLQCERCLRLGAVCLFSPRAPRGSIKRREHSSRSSVNQQTAEFGRDDDADILRALGSDGRLDVGVDWPVQGDAWSDLLASSNDPDLLGPGSSHLPETTITEPPLWSPDPLGGSSWSLTRPDHLVETLPTPESPAAMTLTHGLANMSIALAELTAKLPSPSETPCAREKDRRHAHRGMPFIFEELFAHTTQFTNLVKHLLVDRERRDEATILMVASCHSRLAETYGTIFSLIQRCIQHSLRPAPPDWAIVLPQVQLGSLTSNAMRVDGQTQLSPGKTTMYMLMITLFSSNLWTQLIDVFRGQYGTSVVASGRTSLVLTLWSEMADRMDGLLQTIERTQSLLR